ncbi:MAG: arylsulfatase [Hyphomonadaceae bacterium]|nr:arylsulfatase [Hyphomonadaceae bacterium]
MGRPAGPLARAFALVAAMMMFGGCASMGGKTAEAPRSNILLILADDLGYSDIGPFGSEIRTPNIDALAREGRLLTSFYATSMPSSRAEVMTGSDHHLAGMGSMYTGWGAQARTPYYLKELNPTTVTAAELLRDAGYHTYMIGTWHLGETEAQNPHARGFEYSHALLPAAGTYWAPPAVLPEGAHQAPIYSENGQRIPAPEEYITDFWTDWLISNITQRASDGRPFFAYAAYTSPHFPLQVTDAFIDRYRGVYDGGFDALRQRRIARQRELGIIPQDMTPAIPAPVSTRLPLWSQLTPAQRARESRRAEIYAAMIENFDWNIGRLIAALKASGQYDNTLIVFTSGNGAAQGYPEREVEDNRFENMGRKGSWIYYTERWAEASNAPFASWKAKPMEGGISVPTIVRLPGQTTAAPTSDAISTLRDLLPTFAEIAGAELPNGTYKGRAVQPITGRSMLPFLRGQASSIHPADAVFADENSGEAYVRQGEWKAVLMSDSHTNPFERGEPDNLEHLTALRAGDFARAAQIRERQFPARWRLYNMRTDRGETRDVAAEHPDVLARLRTLYEEYRNTHGVVDP